MDITKKVVRGEGGTGSGFAEPCE